MMQQNQELRDAKREYLRTGYCRHPEKFKVAAFPLGTNTVITSCGVCAHEFDRRYVSNPKT